MVLRRVLGEPTNRYGRNHMSKRTDGRVASDRPTGEPGAKLEWRAPRLTVLGSAAALTMNASKAVFDGGTGSS
jgi:hypothetical protein